jgi:hypothetical protein
LSEWRPTVAWIKSLARTGVTNFAVLTITFWLLPGVRASGGPMGLVNLMIVLALVGMAMRWVLLGVAVLVGGVGVLLLGTVLQTIVMFTGLRLADGVSVDSFLDAWIASWLAAILTAWINWLADAGSDDVYLRQTLRRMARTRFDAPTDRPGVLIVQIDGLSEPLLSWAVKAGNLPNLGRWVRTGTHSMVGWHTGMPATTPASQAGILHGDAGQVPAFRWYEKDSRRLVVTNRPRDAADVERRISTGRGLLADGGASISNVFSGDAPTSLLTFSNAGLPGRSARGYLTFVASPYGLARALVLSVGEMLKEVQQARRQRRRDVYPRVSRHAAYVALRAVTNVVLRDLNVSLIAEQMSRGASVIYCDFVDYDEVAHHAGPLRPEAMQTLEGLDRVLGTLHRLAANAARRYEIVVLSDHGQSQGATFRQRYGETLEEVVAGLVRAPVVEDAVPTDTAEEWGRVGVLLGGSAGSAGSGGSGGAKVLHPDTEARACAPVPPHGREPARRPPAGAVITVASGNLAMIYLADRAERLTLEDLEAIHPDLVPGLARHPGVGFVVVRSATDGPVVVGQAGRYRLRDGRVDGIDPLARYGPHASRDLRTHQAMAHVGDVVVVSRLDRGTEEVAAFEELVGSHGGIGGWQTEAVLVHPATWRRYSDTLIGPDAIYRQLVVWLDELGLRGPPASLAAEPSTAPVSPALTKETDTVPAS